MNKTEKEILTILTILAVLGAIVYFGSPPAPKTTTEEANHTTTTIVTVKKPDGTTTTTEKIDSKTKTNTVVVPPRPKLNVSVLVANDFSKNSVQPLYGVSISKEVLGPVTAGAFALTNGTIGVSIGVNF